MGRETTSLLATGPGTANATNSKIFFYVFQVAPEWLAAAILLGVNMRELFETGLWGDLGLLNKK
ncbi:hypothetical protein PHLCEN_2v4220 [Hermanssonia centrifuga]|uniref:Uncharacterized protein n=1 Tax=Hermanssonia centrifuga TaxID=98765 RepID=A0A2R6PZ12_9APHY|nr:hypothetical protein PHLCEN_2v4220 [Hermanssonia centrifuga]